VQHVFKTDETFPGPHRHHLPDLIVSWVDSGEISAVCSPDTGLVSGTSPDARAGNHRPTGFFMMKGPHVSRGHVVTGGHICDIAPTILASFGVTPPVHMDGTTWTEASVTE